MPSPETPGAPFQEKHIDSELPDGKYTISVEFTNRKGEKITRNISYHAELTQNETENRLNLLKGKVLSEVTCLGLHNFGMDCRYPVGFTLKHESGKELKFEKKFNASGYVEEDTVS